MVDGGNVVQRICFPFLGWFIPAYLGLYLLSPILNKYSENAHQKDFGIYLIAFFSLQAFFDLGYRGLSIEGRGIFNNGYSILSFIPLYLLGRYLKLHRPAWMNRPSRVWLGMYVGVFVISAITVFFAVAIFPSYGLRGSAYIVKYAHCYTSPICILGSVFLFLAFEASPFNNRFVNRLAASVLGVFCFHSMAFYAPVVKGVYHNHFGVTVLLLDAAFIVVVYAIGSLVDQVRIVIWNFGSKYVLKQ